ncbi:MAG TPA: hypothetical protein VMV23_08790 [Candidatus Nanopelagicaceae bacterium]|nr:hypothetical protein [Candidatus Nanopelagicaceae bacterium]
MAWTEPPPDEQANRSSTASGSSLPVGQGEQSEATFTWRSVAITPPIRLIGAVAAGLLGLLALLLPWFGVSASPLGVSVAFTANGFGSSITNGLGTNTTTGVNTISWAPVGWLYFLSVLAVAAAAVILFRSLVLGIRSRYEPIVPRVLMIAGGVEALATIVYWIEASASVPPMTAQVQAALASISGSIGVDGGLFFALIIGFVTMGLAWTSVRIPTSAKPRVST